ncbi:MAG: hypothetical protein O3A47_08090, partial [Chloroflexi bacterium]|nr:hypothetical protein [Chloroflexota bacterium]
MSVPNTYQLQKWRPTEGAASATAGVARPGLGSWLAVLLVGVSALALLRNEQIVVWLLSENMVGEGSTRSLPDVLRWLFLATGAIALALAWRISAWAAVRVLCWGPVRIPAAYTGRVIGAAARPFWVPISATLQALRSMLASTLAGPWLGVTFAGTVAGGTLRSLWSAASVVIEYCRLRVLAAAGIIELALHSAGRRLSAILGHLWSATSTVAIAVGLGLSYVLLSLAAVLVGAFWVVLAIGRPMWRSASIVAGVVGRVLQNVWTGVVAARQAARVTLHRLWASTSSMVVIAWSSVSTTTSLAIQGLSQVVRSAAGHLKLGISTVGRYAGTGISMVVRRLRLVGSVILRGTGLVALLALAGLLFAALVVARGVSLAARYISQRAGAAASISRRLTIRGIGYMRLGAVALFRPAARGAVIVMQSAGLALRYLLRAVFSAIVHALSFVGVGAAYMRKGVLALSRPVARGAVIVIRAAGLALRYVLLVGVMAIGHAFSIMATAAVYLRSGVLALLRPVARGAVTVIRTAGLALSYVLRAGVMAIACALSTMVTGAAFIRTGVVALSRPVGLGVLFLMRGAGFTLRFLLWAGIAAIAYSLSITAKAGEYIWAGVRFAARPLWSGALIIAGSLRLVTATIASYLWSALSIAARSVGRGLRGIVLVAFAVGLRLYAGADAAARILWWGLATVTVPLRVGVAVIGRLLLQTVSSSAGAAGFLVRYLGQGALVGAFAVGWLFTYVWAGIVLIGRGLARSSVLTIRTVTTGSEVALDVSRIVFWAVKRREGVMNMSEVNLGRDRLLSLVVTVLVFFTVGSVGVRLLWPAPPEPTVVVTHWVTGHLYYGANLPDMAEEFNRAGHRSESGNRIVVKVYDAPSSEGARDLLSRVTRRAAVMQNLGGLKRELPDPTIVTPSGAHWLVSVNHEAGREVVDLDGSRSIARAYAGIVTYRDMAECLGWPEKEIGFADIIELRNDPDGWGRYPDCAQKSWGPKPLVAYTDPRTSSTG